MKKNLRALLFLSILVSVWVQPAYPMFKPLKKLRKTKHDKDKHIQKKRANSLPAKEVKIISLPNYSQDTINHKFKRGFGALDLFLASQKNNLTKVNSFLRQPNILEQPGIWNLKNGAGNNNSEVLIKDFLSYAELLSSKNLGKLLKKMPKELSIKTNEDLMFYFVNQKYVDLIELLINSGLANDIPKIYTGLIKQVLNKQHIEFLPLIYDLIDKNCTPKELDKIIIITKLQHTSFEYGLICKKVRKYFREHFKNQNPSSN